MTGVKKDVGEVGKNVEEQKAKYDEVLKIGLSKEQLEADPKKVMEEKRKEEREIQMQMAEAMERDKRRNNLIIMGLVEERNEHETEKNKRNDCGYDRQGNLYRNRGEGKNWKSQ